MFTNFLKRVELSVTLDDAWTKVSMRGGDPGTFDRGVGGGAGRVHTLIKKVPFFPFILLPILAKTCSKISKFYILQVEQKFAILTLYELWFQKVPTGMIAGRVIQSEYGKHELTVD